MNAEILLDGFFPQPERWEKDKKIIDDDSPKY